MIRLYLLLTFLIPLASVISAPNGATISSYEGRHFLVGFLDNEIEFAPIPNMTIYISSKYNTRVIVKKPLTIKIDTIHLKKNEVERIIIQYGYEHKISETIHSNMLIEILSESPISCVAKSSLTQSGDKFSVIPTRNWGTEHYAVTMPNDYYISNKSDPAEVYYDELPRLGEFLVFANENYTNVEVTVAAETYSGTLKDSTFRFMLNKGQSYLVKSKHVHGVKGIHDLTGSKITSDKPVGVISGHMRTSVYQQFEYNSLGSKDHIVEMIPSSNAWSNEYISLPFGNGIKSMFKIVAKDTLSLTFTNSLNTNSVNMLPGEARQFDNIDLATHWTGNGKFLLSQFMAKNVLDNSYFDFDPSMVIIPALDKMVSSVTYFASNERVSLRDQNGNSYTTPQYRFQALLLLADSNAKESVRVNGFKTKDVLGFYEIEANGVTYYWRKVFVPASEGVVNIEADSGRFHAIAIGNGLFDSYAMTVGASLLDEQETENNAPFVQINEICDGFIGFAIDSILTSKSGINIVEVDESVTTNIDWNISSISDTTTFVELSGKVIDMNFDAKFKCSIIDYSGNTSEYEFFRAGSLIKLPNKVDFKEININKDSCITFLLRTEADSVFLDDITFPNDSRLDLKVPFSLPHTLYKGKDYYMILCLNNESGDLEAVLDSIQFNFGCDYTRIVQVGADIISYNLAAESLVLPKILGGTSYDTDSTEFVSFTNVGNTTLIADSVYLPQSNFFTIDTTGMFPDTLLQGDKIVFNKIKFTQVTVGAFNYEITLIDNQSILRKATIIGNVGTPLINDLNIDFGNTRIGTNKDSTVYFENIGTFLSKFTLYSLTTSLTNDPNEDLIRSLDTIQINETENFELQLSYSPADINDYNPYLLEAKFVERWTPHDTISLIITGQPTLPQVRTYNIDLDTIQIFNSKDSLVEVISSFGNEILNIKRIVNLNGDESVFEFENNFYNSRDLDISFNDSLQVKFNGLTLGPQSMLLLVESDAMPNYGTKIDTIRIIGYVREQDTLALGVGPENKIITSCNYDTLQLEISNTGNTIFSVENISITSNFAYTSLIDNILGEVIDTNSSITKRVLVFSSGNRTDEIQYEITVHDITQDIDSTISVTSTLESRQEQVIIEQFGTENIDIGEYFSVYFSGTFPNEIDTTANIQLEILVDVYNFYLHKTETTINFYDKLGNLVNQVAVALVRESDRITLISENLNDFDFTNIVNWDFSVDFLALLHTDLEGGMEIVFNMSDCFDNNNLLNILDVEQICTYRFRNINLNSLYLDANLMSNIVTNEANLEVNSNSNQPASVYIMDYLGKKYSVLDKILFDKGKNNIILNLSDYANGKYILVVQTNSTTITKEIIIIK